MLQSVLSIYYAHIIFGAYLRVYYTIAVCMQICFNITAV